MSDIVERLKEPDIHYPGNFDTPKRANAMLSCLCQEAAEEIESLRKQLSTQKSYYESVIDDGGRRIQNLTEQLAASQAREQQWCEAYVLLENFAQSIGGSSSFWGDMEHKIDQASTIANFRSTDTTALEAMIAKAGEVMLDRCEATLERIGEEDNCYGGAHAIRAIPEITMDDLK